MKPRWFSNLFTLLSANLLPPILVVLSTPLILARHPRSYGEYAVLSAIAAVVAVVSSGRYEQLLPLVADSERPKLVRRAHFFLAVTTLTVAGLGILLAAISSWSWLSALALAALILGQGIYQISYYRLLAADLYRQLRRARLIQIGGMLGGQLAVAHPAALWLSEALSRMLMVLFVPAVRQTASPAAAVTVLPAETLRPRRLGFMAASLTSALATQLPLFYVAISLSGRDLSIYSAIDRMVHVPLLLVATTVGQYLFANSVVAAALVRRLRGRGWAALGLPVAALLLLGWLGWRWPYGEFPLSIGWLVMMVCGFLLESVVVVVNQMLAAGRELAAYWWAEGVRLVSLGLALGACVMWGSIWTLPALYLIAVSLSLAVAVRGLLKVAIVQPETAPAEVQP